MSDIGCYLNGCRTRFRFWNISYVIIANMPNSINISAPILYIEILLISLVPKFSLSSKLNIIEKCTIIQNIIICGNTKWLYIHYVNLCILIKFYRDYGYFYERNLFFYDCLRNIRIKYKITANETGISQKFTFIKKYFSMPIYKN